MEPCVTCGQPRVPKYGAFCSEGCTAIYLVNKGHDIRLTQEEQAKKDRLDAARQPGAR